MPSVQTRSGRIHGVIDAKHKNLRTSQRLPTGIKQSDVYQVSTYLLSYAEGDALPWGMLAYPIDPAFPANTFAEDRSPWHLPNGAELWLVRLPHDHAGAIARIREICDLVD